MGTLSDAINAIKPQIANITSISVKGDGSKRGSTTKNPTGSIYVWRDGSITVRNVSGSLDIVMQGGNPLWEGQINPVPGTDPGFSKAQNAAVDAILDFVEKNGDMNKIEVDFQA